MPMRKSVIWWLTIILHSITTLLFVFMLGYAIFFIKYPFPIAFFSVFLFIQLIFTVLFIYSSIHYCERKKMFLLLCAIDLWFYVMSFGFFLIVFIVSLTKGVSTDLFHMFIAIFAISLPHVVLDILLMKKKSIRQENN